MTDDRSESLRMIRDSAAGLAPRTGDLRRIRALRFTEPGFDRDEEIAHLGEALKLPRQHEHLRGKLEKFLAPLAD